MARKTKRDQLNFELTPLIDVVFLLLIFFLVSSVFKQDELALLLKLPKSEEGKGEKNELKVVTIELTGDSVAVNGKKMEITEVEAALTDANEKTVVNLRADGEVKYQRLVLVLDILQKKKLENISLITEKNK